MFSQEKYLKALNYAAKAYGEEKENIKNITAISMEVIHASVESKMEDKKSDLAITVAILHDIISNTKITYDDIYVDFGIDIAEAVDAFTKDERLSKKDQLSDTINNLLAQSYEVQMVELASQITKLQKPDSSLDNEMIFNNHKEAKFILSCLKNSNASLSQRLESKIAEYRVYIK